MIALTIDTRRARVTEKEIVTIGSVGIQVQFTFSDDWDGLARVACFMAGTDGEQTEIALPSTNTCVIPSALLVDANEDEPLMIGAFGVNTVGSIVIPTVWASAGIIRDGVDAAVSTQPPSPEDYWSSVLALATEATDTAGEAVAIAGDAFTASTRALEKVEEIDDTIESGVATIEEAGATQVQNVNDAGDAKVEAVNLAGSTQIAAVNSAGASIINALPNTIAANYSASKTYAVGDYVLYNNALYQCTTAIDTAEEWTAEHWTAAKVADEVSDLNRQINELNLIYYADGNALDSTTRTQEINVNIPVNHNGSLCFTIRNASASNGYGQVYFYDANDTQVYGYSELLNADSSVTINNITLTTNAAKLRISNPSGVNNMVFSVYMSYSEEIVNSIDEIDTIENKAFINYGNARFGYVGNDGVLHPQSSGNNKYIEINNVKKGDIYRYSGGYSDWSVVFGYKLDGTPVSLLPAGVYSSKSVVINTDEIITLRAWSDISVHDLEFYGLNNLESKTNVLTDCKIVVDINGNGDFSNIADALDYAKNNYNVNTQSVDIYIKDGIYNVFPTSAYPFYALDKGANRINIKGQSREHTIIRCTCTAQLQGIALNIGGECVIENLTIENLADTSYTQETMLSGNHRPYCIHNDSPATDESIEYSTVVRNCNFYSECMMPVGAGLRNNQMQIYDNIKAIWSANAIDAPTSSIYAGAVYVHAPSDPDAIAKGVRFIDCIMIAECERPALQLPNVAGSQSMADVEQTFVRNVTASMGTIEVSLSAPNNKTFWSKSNSNAALNA